MASSSIASKIQSLHTAIVVVVVVEVGTISVFSHVGAINVPFLDIVPEKSKETKISTSCILFLIFEGGFLGLIKSVETLKSIHNDQNKMSP